MFASLSHGLLGFPTTILLKLMYILRALYITYSGLDKRQECGIIRSMNSIVRDYLVHALEDTNRLAKRLNRGSMSPVVAMWQEGHRLVIASCDSYQQHEFRLFIFRDDLPPLLHERVLAFSPTAIAATARAFYEQLGENDLLHVDYEDDKTTILLSAPCITIGLKATESLHRDHIRRFAATFTEIERPDVIKVNAKELLAALPKPRRNNERTFMFVHFHECTWQVGVQSKLNSWQPTEHNGVFDAQDVQGTPDCKLNVQMLREALEVAERYHPFSECTISLTKRNEAVLVQASIGKVMDFRAYIMPVVNLQ